MQMDAWAWFLVGAVIGGLIAWAALQARITLWRSAALAWEDSAKTLQEDVEELKDLLHPPR